LRGSILTQLLSPAAAVPAAALRMSRRCGEFPLSAGGVFACLSPFAGAETSTNRLAVQGWLKPLAGEIFVWPKIFPLAPGQLNRTMSDLSFAATRLVGGAAAVRP